MSIGHTVSVTIDEVNQTIATEIASLPQDDIFGQHIRQVIQLQDAKVREALIKLGWTPPGAYRRADGTWGDWLVTSGRADRANRL
jgi:hypothetical protein